jgi:hypothetical protein
MKYFMGLNTPSGEPERSSFAEMKENPDFRLIDGAVNLFYAEKGSSVYVRNFVALVYDLWHACGYHISDRDYELFLHRMKQECLEVLNHISEIPLDYQIPKNMPMERAYAYRSLISIRYHYGEYASPELLRSKMERVVALVDSFGNCLERARQEQGR